MYAQRISAVPARAEYSGRSLYQEPGQQARGQVTAVGAPQKVSPGKTLFAEGDEAENVFEVARGMLRLCKLLADGRRQITGFLTAGHILGLADQDAYLYTAEAITEVTVYRYSRTRFERMLDEVPGFAKRLLGMTSNELCAAQDQMLLLGRKSATEKLASFLLLLAKRQDDDDCNRIQVPMTRADIADYLGLTVETVSRNFTRLRQEEIIALRSTSCVEVLDRDQLEELAANQFSDDF